MPWIRRLDPVTAAGVAVAAALRLGWIIVATRAPQSPYADPAEYLSMADSFARGDTPRFHGGLHTAWMAPGYSMVLAPFVRLAEATGVASPAFTAALVNATAGVLTVALTGALARRWSSQGAARVAVWVLAVAPAQIMFTSTAHAETVFTFLVILACWLCTRVVDAARPTAGPPQHLPTWPLLGIGALMGFIGLVRTPGMVVLVVPALLLRTSAASWATTARATGLVLVGAIAALIPWTVRNAVQVDHRSPFSTGNATALCWGHDPVYLDSYSPTQFQAPLITQLECQIDSPYDDPRLGLSPWWHRNPVQDEARWYARTNELTATRIRENWRSEPRWTWDKVRVLALSEAGIVSGARNFTDPSWAGSNGPRLERLAELWLWSVLALAVIGTMAFAEVRRCRAAVAMAMLFLVTPAVGIAYPHQHHTAMPFLVILAAVAVTQLRAAPSRSAPRRRTPPPARTPG